MRCRGQNRPPFDDGVVSMSRFEDGTRVVLGWLYTNTPVAGEVWVTATIDGCVIGAAMASSVLRTEDGDR